jgi:hypothetical protein
MDHVVGTVIAKYLCQASPERTEPSFRFFGAPDQSGAELFDLPVKWAFTIRINEKVHRHALSIDVSKNVHQPGLDSAVNHTAGDMQDLQWRPRPARYCVSSLTLTFKPYATTGRQGAEIHMLISN